MFRANLIVSVLLALATVQPALADTKTNGGPLLEAKMFPLSGPVDKLEAEVLDYRYAPQRWQACIGLPDDPHKSIVGCDGGLYYQFGGGPYHEFGVRVLAGLEADGEPGKVAQRLLDARTPIVLTQLRKGGLVLTEEAWAGAPHGKKTEDWAPKRLDYLWLKLKNEGREKTTGAITVEIAGKNLLLNDARTRLVEAADPQKTFCTISPPCEPVAARPPAAITVSPQPTVQHHWAQPKMRCDPRFKHVLIGFKKPLAFKYRAEPAKKYRVAVGLIEGWHPEAGKRPLEIRIEGKTVATVDLVKQYGRNVPAVLLFDAADDNRDGTLEIGVGSPTGAEDTNTILSALWIFDAANAPTDQQILAGGGGAKALAVMDAVRLSFARKELAPGEETSVLLGLYQGAQANAQTEEKDAGQEKARAVAFWKEANIPYDRITVADRAVQSLLDSCIRNIYQAREIKNGRPAFQVGPTCYRGTWAADGPFILESITYLGRAPEVRAGLENQVDGDSGPGGVEFSKKPGLRLWMVWRHAQLTGDLAWLKKMWPRVDRDVKQIIEYRKMTRSDPQQMNFGLMPQGFGDGGLGGKHREYTNIYWTLAGLQAAIDMAQKLDNSKAAADWKAEYQDYWAAFDKARDRDKLKDAAGNVYVPVTMKGEQVQLPQRGAWAFLQSIFPGRIFADDDKLMLGTLAMLDANQRQGLIYGTGWIADGVWNYAASFYGHAHLWLGHGRKAAATLYAFGNHACPLGCWREEQRCKGDPEGYCGDMPHNWASAEFIRLARHLLVLERGNELHLLEGLPKAWARPGDETRLVQVPTSFGPINLTLTVAKDGKSARLDVTPPSREPLAKIVVHLEHFGRKIKTMKVGGSGITGAGVQIAPKKDVTLELLFDD